MPKKFTMTRRRNNNYPRYRGIAPIPRIVGAFPTGSGFAQRPFRPFRVSLAFQHIVDIETPYEDIRFAMNSLYDPLYDTGGGSASFFTSLAQIYPRYIVRSARIEASIKTTAVDTVLAVVPSNSANPNVILTMDHALELPGTQWVRCTDNGNPSYITSLYTIDQIEGYNTMTDRSWYSGTSTSSPSKIPIFHVLIRPENSSLNNNAKLIVKIVYDAILYGTTTIAN